MALDKLVDSTQLDSDLTSVADAIRTKGGTSASLAFPAGFVSAIGDIPTGGGGGGGVQTIASGTFTGNDAYDATIPVGGKMSQTDFVFNIWVESGAEFGYDNNSKVAILQIVVRNKFTRYDLSSDGTKSPVKVSSYQVNNSGTISTVSPVGSVAYYYNIRNAAISYAVFGNPANVKIIRDSSGFSINVSGASSSIKFASGITYNWEVLYIGSDAANDIVEVA